jgi:hypothetical protein
MKCSLRWGKPLKSNDKLHTVSCDFDSNSFSYKWKVLTGESEVTSGLWFAQLSYLFHSAPANFILAYQQLLMLMWPASRPAR